MRRIDDWVSSSPPYPDPSSESCSKESLKSHYSLLVSSISEFWKGLTPRSYFASALDNKKLEILNKLVDAKNDSIIKYQSHQDTRFELKAKTK